MEDGAETQGEKLGVHLLEVLLVHLLRLIVLPAEGLDLMEAGQVILELAVELARLLLGQAEIGPHLLGEDHPGKEDQGDGGAGDEGQLPVDGQQDDQHPQEGHQIGEALRDDVGIELLEIPGVVHHPAHEVAGLLVVEIAQVHPFQLVVGPGAQVPHQVPGRLVGQIIAQKAEQHPEQVKRDKNSGKRIDLIETGLIHTVFHDPGHGGEYSGGSQVHPGQSQCGKDRNDIESTVADGFAAELPEHVHGISSGALQASSVQAVCRLSMMDRCCGQAASQAPHPMQ